MQIDRSIKGRIFYLSVNAILLVFGVACLFPLLHVLALSLSDRTAAIAGEVGLIPVKPTISSYQYLLQDSRFFTAFGVSTQRVLLGGTINLVVTILMAFPLSMETDKFPSRNRYMWFVVFTMLFGGSIVPWFFVIKSTNLLDSIWALVIPGAVPVYNVILLMNFFRNLPKAVKESAEIDGVNAVQMMLKIFVPLALPALATVTLFSIVGHWNNFFDGMLLINSPDKVPLQTYIQSLVVKTVDTSKLSTDELIAQMSQRTFNASKIVVSTIPILLIYPFMQRYFISGITLGSVKE